MIKNKFFRGKEKETGKKFGFSEWKRVSVLEKNEVKRKSSFLLIDIINVGSN